MLPDSIGEQYMRKHMSVEQIEHIREGVRTAVWEAIRGYSRAKTAGDPDTTSHFRAAIDHGMAMIADALDPEQRWASKAKQG